MLSITALPQDAHGVGSCPLPVHVLLGTLCNSPRSSERHHLTDQEPMGQDTALVESIAKDRVQWKDLMEQGGGYVRVAHTISSSIPETTREQFGATQPPTANLPGGGFGLNLILKLELRVVLITGIRE